MTRTVADLAADMHENGAGPLRQAELDREAKRMTEKPSRRAKMRALIEDPMWHHPRDVGRELDLDTELRGVPHEQIRQFDDLEDTHPANLLAQTMQVLRPLELLSTFDPVAWQQATGQRVAVVREGERIVPVSVIRTNAELDAAIAAALED